MSLEAVKVGDKIAINPPFSSKQFAAIVTRITPARVIAHGRVFNKKTGREVGTSGNWGAYSAFFPAADHLAKLIEAENIRALQERMRTFKVTPQNAATVRAFFDGLAA